MSKCYAVYRLSSFECDADEFVDFGVAGVCLPGIAGMFSCDLCDLTDSQLEELKNRVGEKYPVRLSKDWKVDQYVCDTILLIKDSIFDANEIDPGFIQKYEQATGVVAKRLFPLKHCINIAEEINGKENPHGKKLPDKSVGAGPPPPKTSTLSGPANNHERDKLAYEYSFNMTWTWGDIAVEVNKKFPGEQLDADSAATAAKRYAQDHAMVPIPRRKTGRKPQNKSE